MSAIAPVYDLDAYRRRTGREAANRPDPEPPSIRLETPTITIVSLKNAA